MSSTAVNDVFGQIFVASQLEQAVIDLHKMWMYTYIKELELQINWTGQLHPDIRDYTTRNHPSHLPEDQLPQLVVVSPGLAGTPTKDGEGNYRATWLLATAIIVSAIDEPATKDLSKFYAACSRAIMLQHRMIGGVASNTAWIDESYDDIEDDTERTLAAGTNYFQVEVDGVVNWRTGPRVPLAPTPSGTGGNLNNGHYPAPDPNAQPGSTYDEFETVDVVLNKEAL